MSIVIVSGAIANKLHSGGEAWVRLSWALGLTRLGFDVVFVEQISGGKCVEAAGRPSSFEDSANRSYFEKVTQQFGLAGSAVLIGDTGENSCGLPIADLLEAAKSAVLLVNIGGHLNWQPLLNRIRHKAYIDIDPGFTQFWHADLTGEFRVPPHDFYFTIGENIGRTACPIPTGGLPWRPIRQPVVLDNWPLVHGSTRPRFTTVANWRGPFGPVQVEGKTFGLKVHEFRKFVELPRRSKQQFEVALNIHGDDHKDRTVLENNGWQLVDPLEVADTPDKFRRYVQGSLAEFSVAQGIYVDTNSGWFSDRTIRYLASGKPVLVQDTGFSQSLPVGEGLLAFRTMEEAVAGAEAITREYDKHSRAARHVAEEFFDSDKVLSRMMDEIGIAPRQSPVVRQRGGPASHLRSCTPTV